MEALRASRKTAGIAVLICFLLIIDLNYALAASGGRMGGWSGGGRSSRSSSSRSSSRSSGRSSSSRIRHSGGEVKPLTTEQVDEIIFWVIILVGFLLCLVFIPLGLWVLVFILDYAFKLATMRKHVIKLQIGFLNTGRSVQKDLNRIAEIADTSTSSGVYYVLMETIFTLQRYPQYQISSYLSVEKIKRFHNAQKRFNELSNEERWKFDKETLVNVNNVKKRSSPLKQESTRSKDNYIVVTILVATNGGSPKLRKIKNKEDLKKVLQDLVSLPSENINGVEVLWTPQDESDTLSKIDFHENYYLLQPLC